MAALRNGINEFAAFGRETQRIPHRLHGASGARSGEKLCADGGCPDPALQILLAQVRACIEAGHFKGDVRAIATMLWTMTHGAVSLLISFPSYPFGEARDYAAKVIDIALTAAASKEIPALVPDGWDGWAAPSRGPGARRLRAAASMSTIDIAAALRHLKAENSVSKRPPLMAGYFASPFPRRESVAVDVGGVIVGGGAPSSSSR